MVLADWIAIGIVLLFGLLGALMGFGKTLKFITGGILGVIISVVICYFLYGVVVSWPFSQDLMAKIVSSLRGADNGFCNFLLNIHIEIVALCAIMFLVVQLARIIIVKLIKNVAEINNVVFKVINKVLGAVLMLAIVTMLVLIVFQIISWVGGSTAMDFAAKLDGSVFKIDELFAHNPLLELVNYIRNR